MKLIRLILYNIDCNQTRFVFCHLIRCIRITKKQKGFIIAFSEDFFHKIVETRIALFLQPYFFILQLMIS
jgi:hypothetical protein